MVAIGNLPASPSTKASFYVTPTTCTIPYIDFTWFGLGSLVEIDEWEESRKDRNLRYGPFHVKTHPLIKSIYSNRKPIPIRQTILQPFRITRQ